MPELKTYWIGVREGFVYYVGGVYRYTFHKEIFLWGQAIAFKVLITIVPISILATGILGRILRSEDAFQNVERFIREYIPSFQRSRVLIDFIERLQAGGTFFTGLGSFALIFAAVTLFTTLRIVIGNVFQEEWHRHRSVLGGYLFDLRMAAQVGVLFLLTIGVSFASQAIQQGGLEVAQYFGLDYVWLREGWRTLFRLLTYLIPYVLSTAMFFQLFFFIPQPRPPKLSAFIGALVTGVLWEAAKLGFTFYAASVAGFDRYSLPGADGEATASGLGEAFGLIIAFVFWIYYSGVVLIVGALIAVLNEKRVRMRRLKSERVRVEEPAEEAPAGEVGGNGSVAICIAAGLLLLTSNISFAQVPLSFINDETTIDKISFKFVDHRTFEDNLLEEQIWHQEAGFWDKVMAILPFVSAKDLPFDPIELQKDVVRLRRFFQRNGYLHPTVDYPASQLDTTDNEIHVIFSIREGPPLIIQDVGFFGPHGGFMADTLTSPLREKWIGFRDRVTLKTGTRYTDIEGIRLQDEVLTWWKNAGFAFAEVRRQQDVDSLANTVDLRLLLDPGPMSYFSEIQIEGNESVSDQIVLREIPFEVGDRYSAKRVAEGQRELFGLNLFRVAVAELPDQPRDSSVTVRYRLSEGNLRHFRAETGISVDQGGTIDGDWTHRNFFGGARQFTVAGTFVSGLLAASTRGFQASTQKSLSATLNQPYIFSRKLSGSFTPSYLRQHVPIQRLEFEETAIRTSLLYTIYNFRTVSLHHTLARVTPIGDTSPVPEPGLSLDPTQRFEVYNRNIFTLSADLGKVDDFIRPSSGFRVRPLVEVGGIILNLKDDVDYLKAQAEIFGYMPLGQKYNLSGRLFLGTIWPQGESKNQLNPQMEFRFDRIRFYAGGPNDVRGWPVNLLGPMQAIADSVIVEDGVPTPVDPDVEPTGGLGKVAANIELRTPFSLLGPAWRGAVFLDMGGVFPSEFEEEFLRLKDISPADLRFGTGVGLRYETVVGFLRLDLGYKINPSPEDLASPEELWRVQNGLMDEKDINGDFLDRFRLHLSIGQAF